jgi:hypothetical protein
MRRLPGCRPADDAWRRRKPSLRSQQEPRLERAGLMQALFRAVSLRRLPPVLIQHRDRGSKYCLHE